jgi:hypothetical protein
VKIDRAGSDASNLLRGVDSQQHVCSENQRRSLCRVYNQVTRTARAGERKPNSAVSVLSERRNRLQSYTRGRVQHILSAAGVSKSGATVTA